MTDLRPLSERLRERVARQILACEGCDQVVTEILDKAIHETCDALLREAADRLDRLEPLIGKWRARAAATDQIHSTMGIGWKVCADELEAALSPRHGDD